jgi:hypothetical protein
MSTTRRTREAAERKGRRDARPGVRSFTAVSERGAVNVPSATIGEAGDDGGIGCYIGDVGAAGVDGFCFADAVLLGGVY